MESRLARQAEAALLDTMRRMTPEQRLDAFLEHCQLVMELYDAGIQLRAKPVHATGEN
jgi:hypothetical protein